MKEKSEYYSPDKKYKLTFFDCIEPRMGWHLGKVYLTNLQNKKKVQFDNLLADEQSITWSENFNYLALSILNSPDCFFIYDTLKDQFASIHFKNIWTLNLNFNTEDIQIEYNDLEMPDQFESDEYPTIHFLKPSNLVFKYSELLWTGIKNIDNFNTINSNSEIHSLTPIYNGWRAYKGILPQSTDVKVEVIDRFAKYGDKQSKKWMEEINARMLPINIWLNASFYIGYQVRQ